MDKLPFPPCMEAATNEYDASRKTQINTLQQ